MSIGNRQNTPREFRAAYLSKRIQEKPYKATGSPQNVDNLKQRRSTRNRERSHTRQPLRSAVSKTENLPHFTLRDDDLEEHKRPTAKPSSRSERQKAKKPASPTVNKDKIKRRAPTRAGIQQAISSINILS